MKLLGTDEPEVIVAIPASIVSVFLLCLLVVELLQLLLVVYRAYHEIRLQAEGKSDGGQERKGEGEQERDMVRHSKGAACAADAPAGEVLLLW